MFKTYFKYGVMNCGKSIELLSNAHNYKTKGVKTYLLTPKQDTRSGEGVIKARIGLSAKADFIITDGNEEDLFYFIQKAYKEDAVLFIDECQFLSYDLVKDIIEWCHQLDCNFTNNSHENFNLLAYGLLTDFNNQLFDGTRAWLEEADSIHEIKTVCHFCNKKATCNYLDKKVADKAKGNLVIGDKAYISVCSHHYYQLMKGEIN